LRNAVLSMEGEEMWIVRSREVVYVEWKEAKWGHWLIFSHLLPAMLSEWPDMVLAFGFLLYSIRATSLL
jgi:hypothetical protein